MSHHSKIQPEAEKDLSVVRISAWLADRSFTIKGQKDCVWPIKAMLNLLEQAPIN